MPRTSTNGARTVEITVQIQDREDGGIRVRSDDVRGLLLSGSDRHKVWGVVGDSVAHLLRTNHGMNVLKVVGAMTAPAAGEVPMQVMHEEQLTIYVQAA